MNPLIYLRPLTTPPISGVASFLGKQQLKGFAYCFQLTFLLEILTPDIENSASNELS